MSEKKHPLLYSQTPKADAERHWETNQGMQPQKAEVIAEPPMGGWDSSYIPGYSDIRHLNELLKKDGLEERLLPIRLQWIRSTGETDRRDMMQWGRLGYELVKADPQTKRSDLLEKHGFGFPPAAHVTPEGLIRKDDLLLAFVDGVQAQKNFDKEREFTREFESSSGDNPEIQFEEEKREKVYLDHGPEAFD